MAIDLWLPLEEGLADICADSDRMRQIISNLVGNALRHAAQGRWLGVRVQAEETGDGHTWSVRAWRRTLHPALCAGLTAACRMATRLRH